MTLLEFQNSLHLLYLGDTDYPTTEDEEWDVALGLLGTAIRTWRDEEGVLWNELRSTLAAAADGDKTVTADTLVYDCPTNFRFPGGYVKVGSELIQVIRPENAMKHEYQTLDVCYFLGNESVGYTLVFTKQQTVGETIDYPYYKDATIPSSSSGIIEMSHPDFAVYFCLSKLHEIGGEGVRALKAFKEAEAKMRLMKVRNISPAWDQENSTQDSGWGNSGFGS